MPTAGCHPGLPLCAAEAGFCKYFTSDLLESETTVTLAVTEVSCPKSLRCDTRRNRALSIVRLSEQLLHGQASGRSHP